jgi:hypothetical protein
MAVSKLNPVASGAKQKKIASFKSGGTWTVPTGVTYAIAHCIGGGGGAGRGSSGDGGNSTVAFTSTVTAVGGKGGNIASSFSNRIGTFAGNDNSGNGAFYSGTANTEASNFSTGDWIADSVNAGNGAYICEGSTVTPAGSITVTVGAGGTAGTSGSAGGSGYVYIEYYE